MQKKSMTKVPKPGVKPKQATKVPKPGTKPANAKQLAEDAKIQASLERAYELDKEEYYAKKKMDELEFEAERAASKKTKQYKSGGKVKKYKCGGKVKK
jgi:hypothetical protein